MQHLYLPALKPMTLVTTASATWPGDVRLSLDVHLPDRDIRLCFGDADVAATFRRAVHSLLTDAGRLDGHEGVLSRIVTMPCARPVPGQLALF